MKNLKKVLALVLAVVMIMGTVAVASAKDYSDVKTDNDYAVAIDVLSNLEILNGFPDETFRPDGLLTRAEAAKIVAIIHNAATNGKIDADIADLYANAQNSFVDCNNSWALPYINYCRITGLADGMTTTTYEPNRKLTGVQFLKLMLTTLNFDSAKEGYTGKGWDINVLNRANEVGLTKGLAEGWRGINELKRGEAAQIIYNALTKYLVEYGQLVKNNYDKTDKYYKTSFISNEQVAKSGYTLADKMGIKVVRTTDDFRRPGYNWSHKSWSKFYMDTPIAEYKEAVSECTLLVAMGVAENKSTAVDLNGWVDGDSDNGSKGKNFDDYGTALNYYAIDGFKMADNRTGSAYDSTYVDGITLKHETDRSCKKVDKEAHMFGGQGDLTQVFETEDGYVLTTIHTYLANVDKVNTNSRKTHATGETTDLTVYVANIDNAWPTTILEPEDILYKGRVDAAFNVATTKYAKDTKLNVTISFKAAQDALKKNASFETGIDISGEDYAKTFAKIVSGAAKVITHEEAESKTGKLTGASGVNYADTTTIDGTKYNDNCRFVYGKDLSKNDLHRNETFKFFFDTNGNVIGAEELGASTNYLVIDRMWSETPNGKFTVKADIVTMDAKKTEAATIKFGPFADTLFVNTLTISNDDRFNTWAYKQLYSYTEEDGVYTVTYAGVVDPWGYGNYSGNYKHVANEAYIDCKDGAAQIGKEIINISESTKVLCASVDGTYKAYTGYSELPALNAKYVDYVDNDNDGYADELYLGDVAYASDAIIGFVANWEPFRWNDEYDVLSVYVDGVETLVNTKKSDRMDRQPGLYEFKMVTDKNGVIYADVISAKALVIDYAGVYTLSTDRSAMQIGTANVRSVALKNMPLYLVNRDLSVSKIEVEDLDLYDNVIIYRDSNKKIVAIYVLDFTVDELLEMGWATGIDFDTPVAP